MQNWIFIGQLLVITYELSGDGLDYDSLEIEYNRLDHYVTVIHAFLSIRHRHNYENRDDGHPWIHLIGHRHRNSHHPYLIGHWEGLIPKMGTQIIFQIIL